MFFRKQAGGVRGIIGLEGKRGIGKDQIVSAGLGMSDHCGDILLTHRGAEAGVLQIAADNLDGFAVTIDKQTRCRPSTEGFDADGAAAGEKVEDPGSGHRVSQAGENRATDAVHHGAGHLIGAVQTQAARATGYDTHASGIAEKVEEKFAEATGSASAEKLRGEITARTFDGAGDPEGYFTKAFQLR